MVCPVASFNVSVNPIKVDRFAALFNYTQVDRASDFMMAPT